MKTFLKVLQLIIFCVMALAEFVIFIGVIGAAVDPVEGRQANPADASAVLAVVFAILTAISIGGIYRAAVEKRLAFATVMLMELGVLFTGLAVLALVPSASFVPAAVVFGGLGAVTLIGAVLLGRLSDKLSREARTAHINAPAVSMQLFDFVKAEWYWNAAAAEYFGSIPEVVSESESDAVLLYASMPMASYLCWLIQRDLVSHEIYTYVSKELIDDIKSRRARPTALMPCLEFCLSKDIVCQTAYRFTDQYFWDKLHRPEAYAPHSLDSICYIFDYADIFSDGTNLYVNEYTDEKQIRLEQLLDRRYEEFDDDGIYEYRCVDTKEDTLLGKVDIFSDSADAKYRDRCTDLISKDSALKPVICERLKEFRRIYDDTPVSDEEIIQLFGSPGIYIPAPQGDEPAFCVVGGGELEPEHGCGFTVRGDYITEVTEADDVAEPWSETFEKRRALDMAKDSQPRWVYIIPPELGGEDTEDNRTRALSGIADLKEKCERRILILKKQGFDISPTCAPRYTDGTATGFKITAEYSNGRMAFYEYLHIPG
ncbi:MAG: hypothetical protein ILP19_06365 [Oscillospiraceae bacterium]|nr:hypothetical protein [Oscillospiraceae bacterium]